MCLSMFMWKYARIAGLDGGNMSWFDGKYQKIELVVFITQPMTEGYSPTVVM